MTKVKVCGIRRKEDIDYVNETKPDYIGFVFAKSKREVTLEEAAELSKNLSPEIKKVGVFVNRDIEDVKKIAEGVKLDVLQFHGEEDNAYIDNFKGYGIWKAAGINKKEDIDTIEDFNAEAILLDSKIEGITGGTGVAFDWNLIKDKAFNVKIILAGGLNEDNVEKAIRLVKPYAVDVSSGVETNGFKDLKKIKKFIEKVRATV